MSKLAELNTKDKSIFEKNVSLTASWMTSKRGKLTADHEKIFNDWLGYPTHTRPEQETEAAGLLNSSKWSL
jgi:hypothetical protein